MSRDTGFLGDKPVNRIGYGAMQLAGPGVFGPPDDPYAARAVLRRAVELGVDRIDTAQYYGPDVVNDLIRQALQPYPDNLKLATKVGARRDDSGRVLPAQRPEELREGVEANLRSLGVERLDLVNLRLVRTIDSDVIALEEQLGVLGDLRREGKLDLIGLSNVNEAQVQRALTCVGVAEIQNLYSIIDRQDDDLVEFARQHGIAFTPFLPLAGGPTRLTRAPTIVRVADKHRVASTQIALAWLLARDDGILLIPGTSTVVHLEENMAARDIELDDDDLTILDQVARPAAPPSEPLTAANDPGITIIQRGLLTWTWVILPRMQAGRQVPHAGRPR